MNRNCHTAIYWLPVLIAVLLLPVKTADAAAQQDDILNPTVGAAGFIKEIILPGTELEAKPLTQLSKLVVRVINVIPHGDRFRYQFQFHGMEPGKFDLADWLQRKDGSSTDNLPPIPVEIRSLLPPGQITPNKLDSSWFPRLGGYRNVMTAAAATWVLILLGLIFYGKKPAEQRPQTESSRSLADLLQERLDAAANNRMGSRQYAELERMLLAFWRKRLDLESIPVEQAIGKIKQHPESGPLMNQLEQWMHNPAANFDVDLAGLLQPYRNLPANTPGFESSPGLDS